jgi:hypothetical protein
VDLEVGVDKTYSIRPLRDGSEYEGMQKPNETLVAATFSKAKTYVFARLKIRDREVGGSNPLAPTNIFKALTAASIGGLFFWWWQICGRHY